MAGRLHEFLARDHARLDALLRRAFAGPEGIDYSAYAEFRGGLLRHIAMEEKILLPAAQKARGGEPLPIAAKLRLDHGALAALLVPTPTASIGKAIQAILHAHNEVEEGQGGLYEACEGLPGFDTEELLGRLKEAPEVALAPHADGPQVMEAVRRALARAGYRLEDWE